MPQFGGGLGGGQPVGPQGLGWLHGLPEMLQGLGLGAGHLFRGLLQGEPDGYELIEDELPGFHPLPLPEEGYREAELPDGLGYRGELIWIGPNILYLSRGELVSMGLRGEYWSRGALLPGFQPPLLLGSRGA